jgi:2'-deoxynucleoside 5'-phosphate N-hydrolase
MAKVFFGCSMRGGFSNVRQDYLREIPELIESLGHELVSKHQVSATFDKDESPLTEVQIHDRDVRFLLDADYVIAEISNPSLGVGGEISDACWYEKPVLCIYQEALSNSISAYIRGMAGSEFTPKLKEVSYKDLKDLKEKIIKFISENPVKKNIIKVGAAMINEKGEFLIVRKEKSETYINPGGRTEGNESYLDTLKRELKEELQVDVVSADYYKSYFAKSAVHDPECSLTFHLFIVKWSGEIIPSNEIFKADWLSKKDLDVGKYQVAPTLKEIVLDLSNEGLVK